MPQCRFQTRSHTILVSQSSRKMRTTMPEDLNPFHIAEAQFTRAVAYLPQLKQGMIEMLQRPARSISMSLPIQMDDGSVNVFAGYRVLHSRVRGPGKGGIRY